MIVEINARSGRKLSYVSILSNIWRAGILISNFMKHAAIYTYKTWYVFKMTFTFPL